MKIAVLLGGSSAERDVSIATGLRVTQALRAKGHSVTAVDPATGELGDADERALQESGMRREPPTLEMLKELASRTRGSNANVSSLLALPTIREADVVFMGLHGGDGEDGTIQALLDMAGLTYTGSGHLASALAMDKDLSKQLFRARGVPTADWAMRRRTRDRKESGSSRAEIQALGLPVVVKPSKQGSTVGLTVVKREADLEAAVAEAFDYDDEVMVERFIAGRELTVGVLGETALPVGEIIAKHEIYDYECKYTAGMATEVFPADLTVEQTERIQELALAAFGALKLSGCARIDFRLSDDGLFYCLEANTLPGMTELSLIPQAAAAAGISFEDLCERIVHLAIEGGRKAPDSGGKA
jgi:D-alanine-D-alanine ligase